eukprot:TRINITY_DN43590_c0_g1_i2.p1 TRINITY_DN43590_c0_g1~~TRINITY_DN43590_c0_g1_i2.p1  ORF type:complete len:611 (+),score=148.14 TRINITY_DN43590_c0_g1_i2:77-1834(+)
MRALRWAAAAGIASAALLLSALHPPPPSPEHTGAPGPHPRPRRQGEPDSPPQLPQPPRRSASPRGPDWGSWLSAMAELQNGIAPQCGQGAAPVVSSEAVAAAGVPAVCRQQQAEWAAHAAAVGRLRSYAAGFTPATVPQRRRGTVSRLGHYFYLVEDACVDWNRASLTAAGWRGIAAATAFYQKETQKRPPDNALPVQNEVGHWDHMWLGAMDGARCYEPGAAVIFPHWLLYALNLGHSFHRAMAVFNMAAMVTNTAEPDVTILHLFNGDQWHWTPHGKAEGELLRGWWPHLASVLSPSWSFAMLPVPGDAKHRHGALQQLPRTGVRCFSRLFVGWPANRFYFRREGADTRLFRRRLLLAWAIQGAPQGGSNAGAVSLRAALVDRRHTRRVTNAAALVAAPVRGVRFRLLYLEDFCLRRQAAVMGSLDLAAALTGSALIWQLAMCPGSVTLQLAPLYLGGDITRNGTDVNGHRAEMAALAARAGVRHVGWTLGPPPSKKERKHFAKYPKLATEDVYVDPSIWREAAGEAVAVALADGNTRERVQCWGPGGLAAPSIDSIPGLAKWVTDWGLLRAARKQLAERAAQ